MNGVSFAETVCEEWDKAELIRGHALVSQKLMGQGKSFSALASMSTRGIEDVALPEGGVDGINYCDFIERSVLAIYDAI